MYPDITVQKNKNYPPEYSNGNANYINNQLFLILKTSSNETLFIFNMGGYK